MKILKKKNIEEKTKKMVRTLSLSVFVIAIFFVFYNQNNIKMSSDQTGTTPATIAENDETSVCLDPGHGGEDEGASNEEFKEDEINLEVANYIKGLLEKKDIKVYMTRVDSETTLSNKDRHEFCNDTKSDILVSIHHNYFDDPSVDYSTVLYYKDSDKDLANSILTEMSTSLDNLNNGIMDLEDSVLSKSTMPAALTEAFFITNNERYYSLSSGSPLLQQEAESIVKGIEKYFSSNESE